MANTAREGSGASIRTVTRFATPCMMARRHNFWRPPHSSTRWVAITRTFFSFACELFVPFLIHHIRRKDEFNAAVFQLGNFLGKRRNGFGTWMADRDREPIALCVACRKP